jgi:hypothetical protein
MLFKYSCCLLFVRVCSLLFSSSECKNLCAWIFSNFPLCFKFTSLAQWSFLSYSVAFNPRELHLYHIIGFCFMFINFQRAQLGHNEKFHAVTQ